MTTFTKAIEEAVRENDLATDFTIDSNYSVRVEGKEKFQIFSENEVDDKVNHDGTPCVSFDYEGTEYFFVKQ